MKKYIPIILLSIGANFSVLYMKHSHSLTLFIITLMLFLACIVCSIVWHQKGLMQRVVWVCIIVSIISSALVTAKYFL